MSHDPMFFNYYAMCGPRGTATPFWDNKILFPPTFHRLLINYKTVRPLEALTLRKCKIAELLDYVLD